MGSLADPFEEERFSGAMIVGDPRDVQTETATGYVLMGGGTDVNEAMKWIHEN